MKKGFTLMEVIIIVIVVGVLVTLAIPTYNNLIEDSKAKVCQTNLTVLLSATEIYIREHDRLPASLSELKGSAIEKAWADILKRKGSWKIKLAYFLINFDRKGTAYAQAGSWLNRYVGNPENLVCPADTNGYPSYGINQAVINDSSRDYEARANIMIIADSDTPTFVEPVKRHRRHEILGGEDYAQGIDKDKKIEKPGLPPGQGGVPAGKGPNELGKGPNAEDDKGSQPGINVPNTVDNRSGYPGLRGSGENDDRGGGPSMGDRHGR